MKETRRFTSRDVSDAGLETLFYMAKNVDGIRNLAQRSGKKFMIVPGLQSALDNGTVIVLYSPEEVEIGFKNGFFDEETRNKLLKQVSEEGLKEVAVQSLASLDTKKQEDAFMWFLTNAL